MHLGNYFIYCPLSSGKEKPVFRYTIIERKEGGNYIQRFPVYLTFEQHNIYFGFGASIEKSKADPDEENITHISAEIISIHLTRYLEENSDSLSSLLSEKMIDRFQFGKSYEEYNWSDFQLNPRKKGFIRVDSSNKVSSDNTYTDFDIHKAGNVLSISPVRLFLDMLFDLFQSDVFNVYPGIESLKQQITEHYLANAILKKSEYLYWKNELTTFKEKPDIKLPTIYLEKYWEAEKNWLTALNYPYGYYLFKVTEWFTHTLTEVKEINTYRLINYNVQEAEKSWPFRYSYPYGYFLFKAEKWCNHTLPNLLEINADYNLQQAEKNRPHRFSYKYLFFRAKKWSSYTFPKAIETAANYDVQEANKNWPVWYGYPYGYFYFKAKKWLKYTLIKAKKALKPRTSDPKITRQDIMEMGTNLNGHSKTHIDKVKKRIKKTVNDNEDSISVFYTDRFDYLSASKLAAGPPKKIRFYTGIYWISIGLLASLVFALLISSSLAGIGLVFGLIFIAIFFKIFKVRAELLLIFIITCISLSFLYIPSWVINIILFCFAISILLYIIPKLFLLPKFLQDFPKLLRWFPMLKNWFSRQDYNIVKRKNLYVNNIIPFMRMHLGIMAAWCVYIPISEEAWTLSLNLNNSFSVLILIFILLAIILINLTIKFIVPEYKAQNTNAFNSIFLFSTGFSFSLLLGIIIMHFNTGKLIYDTSQNFMPDEPFSVPLKKNATKYDSALNMVNALNYVIKHEPQSIIYRPSSSSSVHSLGICSEFFNFLCQDNSELANQLKKKIRNDGFLQHHKDSVTILANEYVANLKKNVHQSVHNLSNELGEKEGPQFIVAVVEWLPIDYIYTRLLLLYSLIAFSLGYLLQFFLDKISRKGN